MQAKELLEKTAEGRSVLRRVQERDGVLDKPLRSALVKALLTPHFQNDPERIWRREEFTRLSQDIARLFIRETPQTYFSAYSKAHNWAVRQNSGGMLYDCFAAKRKRLISQGDIVNYTRRTKSICSTPCMMTIPSDGEVDEVVTEALEFLRVTIEPWALVTNKWNATRTYRFKEISKPGSLGDYMNKFPCLKTPLGYTLVIFLCITLFLIQFWW